MIWLLILYAISYTSGVALPGWVWAVAWAVAAITVMNNIERRNRYKDIEYLARFNRQ